MDQRAARQEGYGYSDAMNGDWSVQRQQQQLLSPTNSDYQVKPLDGNAPPVFRGPVVNPAQCPPRHSVAAQRRLLQPSPYPGAVKDFDYFDPFHGHRQQYARSVAAPVDSRSSISGSSKASSRASIIQKKKQSKKAIAERKLTPGDHLPRVPRSVAPPDESRSSLSSDVSVSKLSRREAKKLLKQLREVVGEESRSSNRKQKKAAKKIKKGSKGSKKNRQEDSSKRRRRSSSKKAKKSVRFGNNNALFESARRHRELLARENAKCSGTGVTFNGFVNRDFTDGYFDLTSSPDEPGILIKVPAEVLVRALNITDPESLKEAMKVPRGRCLHLATPAAPPPPSFEVYVDSDIEQDDDDGSNRRQPTPAESRRLSVPANQFSGTRRASLSSQRR